MIKFDVIAEAVKVILSTPNTDNDFELELLKFHAVCIEQILKRAEGDIELINKLKGIVWNTSPESTQ